MKYTNKIEHPETDREAKSMAQIVAAGFFEHKMAVVGLTTITTFLIIALSAPLLVGLTGISPDTQNVFNRYAKPFSRIEISNDEKEQAVKAFIAADKSRSDRLIIFLHDKDFVDATVADEDVLYDLVIDKPAEQTAAIFAKYPRETGDFQSITNNFSTYHLLGTDELGRDVFMRLIYGTRVSIGFGILVAFAAALVGLLVGSLAGYYGGWIDAILSRIIDSLLSLPLIPLMIVFAAVDLGRFPVINALIGGENESFFKLLIVIVLFSWMTAARLVRGSILTMKEQDFILAAKTLGAKDGAIILSHIIPNVISPLLVAVTLNVGNSILSEAALSFLGLGIQPPTPSWGNMLLKAQELMFDAPSLAVLPGLMIVATVVSFNFIGDGLQNAIDPKSIRR